jgi:hypothetical protein
MMMMVVLMMLAAVLVLRRLGFGFGWRRRWLVLGNLGFGRDGVLGAAAL